MNILDILLIVIVVFTVLKGSRKGFIRAFTEMISLIGAFFVSFKFYGSFASVVEKFPGMDMLRDLVDTEIAGKLVDENAEITLSSMFERNMNSDLVAFFKHGSFFKTFETIDYTQLFVGMFVNVLAIVILFVATIFILKAVGAMLEGIVKMAGLGLLDRVGGVAFSLLKSVLYLIIISVLVYNVSTFFNSGFLYDIYHNSAIPKAFYESGVIDAILGIR